jgi:hypothetical protein
MSGGWVQGLGFRVQVIGLRINDHGLRVWGYECLGDRVYDSSFNRHLPDPPPPPPPPPHTTPPRSRASGSGFRTQGFGSCVTVGKCAHLRALVTVQTSEV